MCDVLVGADGIRSVTRGVMYRRLVHAGVVRLPEAVSVLTAGGANGNGKVDGESSKLNGVANGDTTNEVAVVEKDDKDKKEKEEKEKEEASPPPSPRTPLDPVADFIDPVWSGTLVYRALIPKAVLDATWPGHRVCEGPVCVSLSPFSLLSYIFFIFFFGFLFVLDAKKKLISYVFVRQYFGKSKHVLAFPIMHTAPAPVSAPPSEPGAAGATTPATTTTPMINLVAFTSQPHLEGTRIDGAWVRPAPAANLLGEFAGWEGEVRALLGLVRDPLLWAIHTVRPLPRFSDGRRVVLLGDAVRFCSSFFHSLSSLSSLSNLLLFLLLRLFCLCWALPELTTDGALKLGQAHAMTPHQGAGGGQAIEDAYVLAALLAHPRTDRETLGRALEAYDAVRVPVAQEVARKSRLNGLLYELNAGVGEELNKGVGKESSVSAGVGHDGEVEGAAECEGEKEKEGGKEEERLAALAAAIMEIHKWEWEEPAEGQPREAVRLFEAMVSKDRKMRKEGPETRLAA